MRANEITRTHAPARPAERSNKCGRLRKTGRHEETGTRAVQSSASSSDAFLINIQSASVSPDAPGARNHQSSPARWRSIIRLFPLRPPTAPGTIKRHIPRSPVKFARPCFIQHVGLFRDRAAPLFKTFHAIHSDRTLLLKMLRAIHCQGGALVIQELRRNQSSLL